MVCILYYNEDNYQLFNCLLLIVFTLNITTDTLYDITSIKLINVTQYDILFEIKPSIYETSDAKVISIIIINFEKKERMRFPLSKYYIHINIYGLYDY